MSIVINPISPVAFSLLGFEVRWYALAYVAGFVFGYMLFKYLMNKKGAQVFLTKKQMDDILTYVILGVILGGRLAYVLFYNFSYFLHHPLEIFAVWNGGMSFHGGLFGVGVAVLLYAHFAMGNGTRLTWKQSYFKALSVLDLMAVCGSIGLFFGRIANFINMEVMGRPTDMPWGVVFVGETEIARHPSPLYEAATEGLLLFIIMLCLYKFTRLRERPGALTGSLVMLYSVFRIFCEQFRAPDVQLGFLTSWGLTMGQLLSGVIFFTGATIFAIAFRKK